MSPALDNAPDANCMRLIELLDAIRNTLDQAFLTMREKLCEVAIQLPKAIRSSTSPSLPSGPDESRIVDRQSEGKSSSRATAHPVEPPMRPIAVSPTDAAKRLGIGLSLLNNDIKSGKLRAHRIGRRVLILETDLMTYAETLPSAY